ncbi:phosphodiesterase [Sphingomonas sp. DBB INV C78]
MPSGRPDSRAAFLKGRRYAHRGLHGAGLVENSQAAFRAAIANGDGIELDVQESRDGQAIVFHDYTLHRLTAETGPLADRTAAELAQIQLSNTAEGLSSLNQTLNLIAGRAPLLIEIKSRERTPARLCAAVRDALADYAGPVAVMSFNPQAARWFATHAPHIVRGLVVTEEGKKSFRGWWERHLALWRARPDFLAYDVRDLPSRFAAAARAAGLPVLSWTVRSPADEATVALHADAPIYERTLG